MTTTGPYVCLRHPLYLGSLLLMLGFAELLEDRIALVAVVLLFALTHIPAMFKEERYMAARYGQQWVAYKSHTPAFFPIRRSGAGLNGWDRSLWRRSDEWACVSLSVLFMAVLQRASTL